MAFIEEVDTVISEGLEAFKAFILKNKQANKSYLEQLFWVSNLGGLQRTVLNHLIHRHQEQMVAQDSENTTNLTVFIDYVIGESLDKNLGEPLHQAIEEGKIQLALHLLEGDVHIFNVNQRDVKGRTLLSLILNTKKIDLLKSFLIRDPNISAPTLMVNEQTQPLHQAVLLDFVEGIKELGARDGVQLDNPLGVMRNTPLLLAARMLKINSLEALLELHNEKIMLDAENNNVLEGKQTGLTAIEELCKHIELNKNTEMALRGVAALLCSGAKPPRTEEMRAVLSSNRVDLLRAVNTYLRDKPDLVDAFVHRCHAKDSELHSIVYANHSWGNAIRHLFGKPSDAAFIVESLVVRKYSDVLNASSEQTSLKCYAEFVRRYTNAYESQTISNSWSTMRWMIAEGECDWETVVNYASKYPSSRTGLVYSEMVRPASRVHDDVRAESLPTPFKNQ